jgi:prophage antirepressor-like protein
MDIFKSFILDGTNYSVNVLWDDEKPYFRASEIGEILQLVKVRNAISDFDDDEKIEKGALSAGGLQKTLFLTEAGLYRLLMATRKPIARPFQKWVTSVLTSIRETGKYELEKYMEEIESLNGELILVNNNFKALQKEANAFRDVVKKTKHQCLIEAFSKKYVVYFGRITIEKGDLTVIKIGSTKNIHTRAEDLSKEFGNFEIIKIIECACNERFERFLHNHKNIRQFAYREQIYQGRKSNEVFKLTDEELETIINIAQHNVYKFRNMAAEQTEIEILQMKEHHIKQIRDLLNEQAANYNSTPLPIERVAEKLEDPNYIDPILLFTDTRKFTQGRGSKVQRYSPDGKTLLQTYESAIVALRDTSIDSPSRTRINEAVKKNTVYKDYRWALLDRKLPDDTLQELEETVYEVIDIRKGFVAMLNLDNNHIVKVFKHQKDAGIDRKFKSSAPICSAIKNGTQSGGFYFKMWYNCSEELQSEYLSRESLPEKYVGGGQRIAKLHPVSGHTMKVYSSITEVTKEFRFSRASLFNAIENEFISKGYRWTLALP